LGAPEEWVVPVPLSEININNPKRASFKENHLMTTARDALRTRSIFRFSTFKEYFKLLNRLYDITWFGSVYA